MSELPLRRKYRFKVHGRSVLLVKRAWESEEHVLLKILGFALYLPRYPRLIIEPRMDDRYRPDLVQLDERGRPLFWGECGTVGMAKLRRLARRHRQTHLAFFQWEPELEHYVALIEKAVAGLRRAGPVELVGFPLDAATRFVADDGTVSVRFDDCTVIGF
ncbi:MAG TPA: hypothetical protein EYP55_01255 [Anaerolineae bacterium]|nr:hypothetical protein [Anaerolineae bacterium]